jgi:hypothetical protein
LRLIVVVPTHSVALVEVVKGFVVVLFLF